MNISNLANIFGLFPNGHIILFLILSFLFSAAVAYFSLIVLIPRLKRAGIIGKDVNKENKPEVAEMGGFGIIAGFSAGIFLLILLHSFGHLPLDLLSVLSVVLVILVVAFIGIIDDLISLPQWVKAILPIFASTPLVALQTVGSTTMFIPFFGFVDFGLAYIFVLVPIGIAVASNLTNMLAGFNGMEAGMGIIMMLALLIVGLHTGNINVIVLSMSMLGALIGFIFLNWYPAKVFPGDIGTLSIGAAVASIAIIGNMESIGALLMVPYVIDFFIKLINRFPSSNWWGIIKNGKLYCPKDVKGNEHPIGFAQHIMKFSHGIGEMNLSLVFIFIELIDAVLVLSYFLLLK